MWSIQKGVLAKGTNPVAQYQVEAMYNAVYFTHVPDKGGSSFYRQVV